MNPYKKDFQSWNDLKQKLHQRDLRAPHFQEREIWYCSIGINVGHEQDGKNEYFERPIIIIKKLNQSTFWGIPLTMSKRTGEEYFHWTFISQKLSTAISSQIRIFDSKRLQRKVGSINQKIFYKITEKICLLINPKHGEIRHPSHQYRRDVHSAFPKPRRPKPK